MAVEFVLKCKICFWQYPYSVVRVWQSRIEKHWLYTNIFQFSKLFYIHFNKLCGSLGIRKSIRKIVYINTFYFNDEITNSEFYSEYINNHVPIIGQW